MPILAKPLMFLVLTLSACANRIHDSSPSEFLSDEMACSEKTALPCGQLAFTLGFEKRSFFSSPVVVLEKKMDSGATIRLFITHWDFSKQRPAISAG